MPLLLIVNEDRVVAVILIRLGQTVLLHQLALSAVADAHSPLSIVSRGNRKILLEVVFLVGHIDVIPRDWQRIG